jgi:hypothetical protein
VRSAVSGALLDAQQIECLIDLWIRGKPGARENERLVLSIHAATFWPMITVSEDGMADDLNHVFKIDGDLSNQQPRTFVAFLKK